MKYIAERRRIRDKEKLDDIEDKQLESEELAQDARKLAEIERVAVEKRKRDEEIKDRMKLKRFIEMKEEIERKQELEKIAQAEALAAEVEANEHLNPTKADAGEQIKGEGNPEELS